MEKDGEARQATGDDTIWDVCFACWITMGPDTLGISNTYCFSMATVVTCSHLCYICMYFTLCT